MIPAGERPIDRQHIVLAGNQPLLLDRSGAAWLVTSGAVSVFAVNTEPGALHGQRRYLFEVGPGEVLLGTTTAGRVESRQECIGVALQESMLEPLPIDELVSTARGRLAVLGWITKLGSMLQPLQPPGDLHAVIATGQHVTLKSGETVGSAGDSLWWVRLRAGSLTVMGYEEGHVAAADEPIPLPPGLWLRSEGAVELDVTSLEEISSDQLLHAIDILEPVCFRALDDLHRLAQSEGRRRFEERRQLNQRLARDTLRDLAAVSTEDARDQVAAASGTPLLIAAQVVGDAQGLVIRPPIGDANVRRPLQAIALASGVRTRSVVLAGKWWLDENGPILAYRDANKTAVALIPSRPSLVGQALNASRYTLFDPADRSWTPVDDAVAATLFSVATTFYRPFRGRRSTWTLIRFGLAFHRRDLAMMLLCALAVAVFGLATPHAFAILVSEAIPAGNRGLLVQVAAGMVVALIAATLFDLTRAVSTLRVQSGMAIALQTGAWDWLLKLRPAFFRTFSVGELRSQIDGFTRIHEQLSPETVRTILAGLAGSIYVGLMLYYDVVLGLLVLLCALIVITATGASAVVLTRLQSSLQPLEASISGLMVQLINAVPKLRVAGAEQRAFAHWGRLYGRKQRVAQEVQQTRDRLRLLNVTMPTLAAGLTFTLALDRLNVATFLAFSVALGVFMRAVTELSDTFGGLVSVGIRWRRAKAILDVEPEVDSAKPHPGRLRGGLSLSHVTFRYREHGPLTLEDVSIHADPGECIALVGPSGCGKSTILDLLLGFEVPASGAVYFDGRDLSSIDVSAVRRQIGVVRQDSKPMADSIFENIICGSRAPMTDAWDAARAAGLADDIEQMPMGMHTIIAEGGSNISGGQRQRLLIARALVLKPRILLFDEATSALDNHTHRTVTESLNRLKATRVVVAHRLSTIRQADRIYVIDAGRVVQVGTYDELASQPGLFARLMQRQII